MALEIIEQVGVEIGPAPEQWTADRKLWKTDDGKVVEDGDPKAAFLYATEGTLIPLKEAEKHGLTKPEAKPDKPEAKPEAKPEEKQAAKSKNKQRTLAKNKSKSKD